MRSKKYTHSIIIFLEKTLNLIRQKTEIKDPIRKAYLIYINLIYVMFENVI